MKIHTPIEAPAAKMCRKDNRDLYDAIDKQQSAFKRMEQEKIDTIKKVLAIKKSKVSTKDDYDAMFKLCMLKDLSPRYAHKLNALNKKNYIKSLEVIVIDDDRPDGELISEKDKCIAQIWDKCVSLIDPMLLEPENYMRRYERIDSMMTILQYFFDIFHPGGRYEKELKNARMADIVDDVMKKKYLVFLHMKGMHKALVGLRPEYRGTGRFDQDYAEWKKHLDIATKLKEEQDSEDFCDTDNIEITRIDVDRVLSMELQTNHTSDFISDLVTNDYSTEELTKMADDRLEQIRSYDMDEIMSLEYVLDDNGFLDLESVYRCVKELQVIVKRIGYSVDMDSHEYDIKTILIEACYMRARARVYLEQYRLKSQETPSLDAIKEMYSVAQSRLARYRDYKKRVDIGYVRSLIINHTDDDEACEELGRKLMTELKATLEGNPSYNALSLLSNEVFVGAYERKARQLSVVLDRNIDERETLGSASRKAYELAACGDNYKSVVGEILGYTEFFFEAYHRFIDFILDKGNIPGGSEDRYLHAANIALRSKIGVIVTGAVETFHKIAQEIGVDASYLMDDVFSADSEANSRVSADILLVDEARLVFDPLYNGTDWDEAIYIQIAERMEAVM